MLNQFAFTSDFLTILLGWDKTLLPLYGSDERSTHLSALFRSAITGYQVPSVHMYTGAKCTQGVHISLFYKITSAHSVEIILLVSSSSSSSSHRHQ